MKRKLRWLGIFLIFAIPLLYFVFTLLFFSPFEDDFGRIEYIIPRRLDLFLRKAGLKDDFYEFPLPKFFTELEISHGWRAFSKTPLHRDLAVQLDLDAMIEQIREQVADLPFINVLDDVIGREVAVAGNFRQEGEFPFSYLVFLRGTWKVKLLFELATWNIVRKNMGDPLLDESSLVYSSMGYMTLLLGDGRSFYMKRCADVIIFGDDESLMQEVCDLISGESGTIDLSIGGSEGYIAKVFSEERADTGYLDFHADLERIFRRVAFDDAWKENRVDFTVMTAMEIFDPDFFRSITGTLRFGSHLDLDARIDFHPESVKDAGTGFFDRDSVAIEEKLDFFVSMLPQETFFAGCVRIDPGKLLKIMERNMEPELRKLITSLLRDGRRYNRRWNVVGGISDFIDTLDTTFGDLAFVALRPRDADKPLIPDVQPIPIIALMLEIEDMAEFKRMEETIQEMQNNNTAPFELWQLKNLHHNCRIKGINTPAAPDIEKIAWTVLDDRYFLLATSDDFIIDILNVRTRPKMSLKMSPRYKPALEFITGYGNLALYLEARGLKDALSKYAVYWAENESRIDYDTPRAKARNVMLQRDFPRFANREKLPAEVERKLSKRLDAEMAKLRRKRVEETIPRLTEEFRKFLSWIDLFRSVSLKVRVHRNNLDLHLRVSTIL